MSLPPGFLDELRNRLSLGQVVGRKVMWDNRKSNQAKGDLWAPCPFHQEKTASFHVDDRKGYYYCFGCHAKGDAITFVRETENVDFIEAVKILAGEAGMTVPDRDPEAQKKADARSQLFEVMEQAVQYHRLQLQTGAAAAARAYLEKRGLSAEAQARWEIGFAPAKGGVFEHLTGKGIAPQLVIDAGLAAESDRGGAPYNRFRDRIMFPIRDARGRPIGFGGRAMDPDHPAKYYNSPETPLFHKGRSLFNHGPAREAAGKGHTLIVAEGYMDVIALSEAGFAATVAPLGTAVTEEQLGLLWRVADEPIIALDGDKAGLRAAMRVIDLALPMLEAGKSLRFALMPEGLDPDDVLKTQGAAAMQKILQEARPMVELLWQRETEGKSFDSPERKAALDKALREKIQLIRDQSIRNHYGQAIKDMRWALFQTHKRGANAQAVAGRSHNQGRGGAFRGRMPVWQQMISPVPAARNSALGGGADETHLREAVIFAALISAPDVATEFETALEQMVCQDPAHRNLQAVILRHLGAGDLIDRVAADIGPEGVEKLFAQNHVRISPGVRRKDDAEVVRLSLTEEFAKLNAREGQQREIADAIDDISGVADEGLTWRLAQASAAVDQAGRGDGEDKAEYALGPNGARIRKEEQSAFDSLIDKIDFAKSRRGPRS